MTEVGCHGQIAKQNSLAAIPGALVLVGAGKMGGAMLDGWLARKLPPKKVVVLEPQPSKAIKALAKRGVRINPKGEIGLVAALVIAVKPQTAPEALPPLAGAGRREDRRGLDHGRAHARLPRKALCRTPRSCAPCRTRRPPSAAASPSRSAIAASRRQARKLAHALLAATGSVEWVDDEALMDAVTAVSGSGPAYVFLLAEAMAQAGAAAGLPAALADKLARETVAGSGELLHRSPLPAATLAPERDLARRHHGRGARGADGQRTASIR